MVPGTILLIEKEILAVSVDDECHKNCEYAITGNDLPASDKQGLAVILLSAYNEMRAFIPPCLFDNLLNQYEVNEFLWRCWREQRDTIRQSLYQFADVLCFPLRQNSTEPAYAVLWIHRYLNFLRDTTKHSPVPSWTGDQNELVKWMETQKWETEINLKETKHGAH
jgi:hypothetical protein